MEHLLPEQHKDLVTLDLTELFNGNKTQMKEVSNDSISDEVLTEILQNASELNDINYI